MKDKHGYDFTERQIYHYANQDEILEKRRDYYRRHPEEKKKNLDRYYRRKQKQRATNIAPAPTPKVAISVDTAGTYKGAKAVPSEPGIKLVDELDQKLNPEEA